MNDIKQKIIRTRYAPSPTGLFHIGGARTALFNFLFAKKNKGDFIVRIEDTDIDRNIKNGVESQLENLRWLKIFFDESILNPGNYGPYIQSEKLERYKELAYKLLEEKKAYRCFCTTDELEKSREISKQNGETPKYKKTCLSLTQKQIEEKINNKIPFAIRLNISENNTISWKDIIRDEISFPTSALTDPIILKSNNYPTYNFAVVIDDDDMKITHVIRGEEHISNTPYQIAIYKALNMNNEILYGHLSVIIDETGKKLSKRNIELKQFIEDYKNMGFTSDAVVNFLYLLGSPAKDNHEIFSLNEAIENFDINKIGKSPSTFDFKKMEWISSEYFKKMDNSLYLIFVEKFINVDLSSFGNKKNDILLLFKNQISYCKQLNNLITNTFFSLKEIDELIDLLNEFKDVKKLYKIFIEKIENCEDWSADEINNIIISIKNETNKSSKDLYMPIRILSTHVNHGPELAKMIYILGKEKVVNNAKSIITKMKDN